MEEKPRKEKLQFKGKFYDFDFLNFTKNSYAIYITLSITETLQRISFLKFNLTKNSTSSTYHKSIFTNLIPLISFEDLIPGKELTFLVSVFLYLLLKNWIFFFKFFSKNKSKQERMFKGRDLRLIYILAFVDFYVLRIPIFHLVFQVFTQKSSFTILNFFLSVLVLIIFSIETFTFVALTFDFEKKIYSFLYTRTQKPKIYDFILTLILAITIQLSLNIEIFGVLNNLLAVIFSLINLHEIYSDLHYLNSESIELFKITLETFVLLESINAFISTIWVKFHSNNDLDQIIAVLSLFLISTLRIFFQRKKKKLMEIYVHQIDSWKIGDQYLDILKNNFNNLNRVKSKFELMQIFTRHFEKCKEIRCLCSFLKVDFGDLKGANLDEYLKSKANYEFKGRFFEYKDQEYIKKVVKKFSENFTTIGKKKGETINIYNESYKQVISNFYYLIIERIKGEKFNIFTSFIHYVVFELNNCVGGLVFLYEYISSFKYKEEKTFYTDVILKNYIDLVKEILEKKALNSTHSLSRKRFADVYDFTHKIEETENLLNNLVIKKNVFFEELGSEKINVKNLINLGDDIFKSEKLIEKNLEELDKKSSSNMEVVKLMIRFHTEIKMKKKIQIRNLYENLSKLKKRNTFHIPLLKQLNLNVKIDLFNENNMVLLVNIKNSNFSIQKFTRNAAKYFGYDPKKFKNLPLKELMHPQISRKHDKYLKNFLNKEKGNRQKVRHFATFAKKSDDRLIMVNLVVKLEFLLLDNIYISALVNPDRKNSNMLCLTEFNGNVVSMNESCEHQLGEDVYRSRHSLFLSIPTLLKMYYPKVLRHMNFKKITKSRHNSKIKIKRRDVRDKSSFKTTVFSENHSISSQVMDCFMITNDYDPEYSHGNKHRVKARKNFLKLKTLNCKSKSYKGKNFFLKLIRFWRKEY